jgi:hypothetical protein
MTIENKHSTLDSHLARCLWRARPCTLRRLDIEDVIEKRINRTRLRRSVTIRAENAATAMELTSRFATNPRVEKS